MLSNPFVKRAIKAREALSTNDYYSYFKIIKEAPYVMKCLMHSFSFEVRKNAIMAKDSSRAKNVSLYETTRNLFFKSREETESFLQVYTKVDRDITLYKIPKIINDVRPGRELQSIVYGTKVSEPVSLFTPQLTSNPFLVPSYNPLQQQQQEQQQQKQREQESQIRIQQIKLEEIKKKKEEEEKKRKEEEEQERLRIEQELREKRLKEEAEERERLRKEEEEREKERKRREEEELRQKRLREEEEERQRLKREEEERKRKEEELRIQKQKQKEEMERKRENEITKAINKLHGLNFSKIFDDIIGKEQDFNTWKIAVIFQDKVTHKDYVGRYLDKKLSLPSNNPNIKFSKVYGTENVTKQDLYCAQTIILYGDTWNKSDELFEKISEMTYINAEVIGLYSKTFNISEKSNKKVILHKISSVPLPHTIDSNITNELESIISESLRKSCTPIKNIGLEKTSIYSYIKLKFEDLLTVRMKAEYIQFWNNPEFFRVRVNDFVSMIENDILGEHIHRVNFLGFSDESFDTKVHDILSKLHMPEIKWNDLLKQKSFILDNAFIEEASNLLESFMTKLNIKGAEIFKENFKRFLCYVASNRNSSVNSVQILSYKVHWGSIFNELTLKIIDEVIKPNDFEVVVDITKDKDRYKSIDNQYFDRIKTFVESKNMKRARKENVEERDENIISQQPALKKRKKVRPSIKIEAELKPSSIVNSTISAEKESWELDFERILSGK